MNNCFGGILNITSICVNIFPELQKSNKGSELESVEKYTCKFELKR